MAGPDEMEEHLKEHIRNARIYTVTDANALVPVLADVTTAIKVAYERIEEIREQIDDLESVRAEAIHDPQSDEAKEYERYRKQFETAKAELARQVERLNGLGAELKDPRTGLVDFYARRVGGETVYLCWRLGEERLRFWHSLTGGFGGRRPVEEL